ncbi:hypothetical protein [Cohnella boryungensis]|jgi:hypothetical protein|uniref:DUF6199 domain-containing protein n=1 Tax=Cohnella boryungensis TaxID=768479 RepID=A0ABV8SHS4_9BACL
MGVVAILFGLAFLFFPRQIWMLERFMIQIKKGKVSIGSDSPTALVIIICRIIGVFSLLLGILFLVT